MGCCSTRSECRTSPGMALHCSELNPLSICRHRILFPSVKDGSETVLTREVDTRKAHRQIDTRQVDPKQVDSQTDRHQTVRLTGRHPDGRTDSVLSVSLEKLVWERFELKGESPAPCTEQTLTAHHDKVHTHTP